MVFNKRRYIMDTSIPTSIKIPHSDITSKKVHKSDRRRKFASAFFIARGMGVTRRTDQRAVIARTKLMRGRECQLRRHATPPNYIKSLEHLFPLVRKSFSHEWAWMRILRQNKKWTSGQRTNLSILIHASLLELHVGHDLSNENY